MEYNFAFSLLVVKHSSFLTYSTEMIYIFITLIPTFQRSNTLMLMKLKLKYMFISCISSMDILLNDYRDLKYWSVAVQWYPVISLAKVEFLLVHVILTGSPLPCLQSGHLDLSYWHKSRNPALGYPAERTDLFKKTVAVLWLSFLEKHSLQLLFF